MSVAVRCLLWLAVSLGCCAVSHAVSAQKVDTPERNFAYVLGDVLIQRVALPSADKPDEFETLATAVRVNQWLERQGATMESDQAGQHWLRLRYQVVNAPRMIVDTRLPAVTLTGEGTATLEVPPWSFSLGPITSPAPLTQSAVDALRADRLAQALDTSARQARMRYAVLGLGVLLAMWILWWIWRSRRDQVRLPFAGAWQALRRMDASRRDDDPLAWQRVHQAFNELAERTVSVGSVDALLKREPWLVPHRQPIDDFFDASSARFFEQPARQQPFELSRFTRALFKSERRHAS